MTIETRCSEHFDLQRKFATKSIYFPLDADLRERISQLYHLTRNASPEKQPCLIVEHSLRHFPSGAAIVTRACTAEKQV